MEKEKIEAWLDALIETKEKLYGLEDLVPGEIEFCSGISEGEKSLHIYKAIQKMADALGEILCCTMHDANTVALYFTYKGYQVFQLQDIEQ